MKKFSYLKGIVIVHGKSELQICQFMKSKLRLKLEIISDKKGEKAIQISNLKNFMNNKIMKKKSSFLRRYEDIELNELNKEINDEFKIFMIMDTDDCEKNPKLKKQYINKEMFKDHWAYRYIVPIYNSPELETVLTTAGVPFTKTGIARKKEYIKLFPTDKKYIKNDEIQIKELSDRLKSNKDTNFNEFFEFCLDASSKD